MRDLLAALQRLGTCSQTALESLGLIRQEADDAARERLVRSLTIDRLLTDLTALEAALERERDRLPQELARLSAVPTAVLSWASANLEVRTFLEPGTEREIPADAAGKYEWVGAPPSPNAGLIRLRVVAPGWKRKSAIVVRPVVEQIRPD